MDRASSRTISTRRGPDVYASVGAYHLEGLGPHLMRPDRGDFYSILGLPLLAVLDFPTDLGALRA